MEIKKLNLIRYSNKVEYGAASGNLPFSASGSLRQARTNHVVSLNHIRQQKRLNRKNLI